MGHEIIPSDLLIEKLNDAKVAFERALDCKHTEFDDLYPYISEHPQFFWYKRYVAWSELLTIIKLCQALDVSWHSYFSEKQNVYLQERVMSAQVLDYWFEKNDMKEYVEK